MKIATFKFLIVFFILCFTITVHTQVKKNAAAGNDYPGVFTLKKQELDGFFSYKINSKLIKTANKYVNGSTVVTNTAGGDMKFLRLQLKYFKNAFMNVQVNGGFSTQVFIVSTDKLIFYKGRFEKDLLIMTKCREDDIVSE